MQVRLAKQHKPSSVIALDLGGTKLAMARVRPDGKIEAEQSVPTDLSGRRACLDQLVRAVQALREPGSRAVGISIPGLVRRDGTVWAPNLPGWTRVPVAEYVRKKTGLPVVVESDRNASVIGETWRGSARGATDAVFLIVGTGIGAGIVSEGRLVRGADELSGCAGWLVVSRSGEEAAEPFVALESLAAGPAMGRAAAVALNRPEASARDAFDEAARGNAAAAAIIEQAATHLGVAVANIISLFNPQVVVLGGGVGTAGPALLEALRRVALRWAQPLAAKRVRIVASRLGGRAPLLGAARLAFNSLPGPYRPGPAQRDRAGGPGTLKGTRKPKKETS